MQKITRLSSLFLSLASISSICAQSVSGTIVCADKPVASIGLIQTDSSKQQILSFTRADVDGNYQIQLSGYKNIYLSIRSLYFENWELFLPYIESDTAINIELIERKKQLSEVTVTAPKKAVVNKGDTAKYTVAEFLEGEEKVLEDLLKKLPGITVTDQGIIKVQGKEINTILLEGDNLFDKKYTIGSKNIDVEAVEEVQAIRNHVKEKSLQGIKQSDDVVLNLKIKQRVHAISGKTALGGGNNGRYNFKTSALNVSKVTKGFLVTDLNNVGDFSSPYHFYQTDPFSSNPQHRAQSLLSSDMRAEEPRNLTRMNRAAYYSISELFKIKQSSLRIQLNHYRDKLQRQVFTGNRFTFNEQEIITTQEDIQSKRPLLLEGEIKHVIRKKQFDLESSFLISGFETRYLANSLNNDLIINSENQNQNTLFGLSSLYSRKLSSRLGLQIEGNATKSQNDEKLILQGSNTDSLNVQTNNISRSFLAFQSSIHRALKFGSVHFQLGVEAESNALITFSEGFYVENQGNQINAFRNDQRQDIIEWYVQSGAKISLSSKWTFEPVIRLSFMQNQYIEFNRNVDKTDERLALNPSLRIRYHTNSYSFFFFNSGYKQKVIPINRSYEGRVVTSYRTSNSNVFTQELQKTFSSAIGYSVNDLFNLFTLNISVARVMNFNNFASSVDIDTLSVNYQFFLQDRSTEYSSLQAKVSKLIDPIRTTVTFEGDLGLFTFNNAIDAIDRTNRSIHSNSRIGFTTRLSDRFTFSNNFKLTASRFTSSEGKGNSNNALTHIALVTLNLSNQLKLIFKNRHLRPSLNTEIRFNFFDFEIEKRFISWDASLSLRGQNMLNESSLIQREVSDFAAIQQSTNLLNRFYLLTFSKRF